MTRWLNFTEDEFTCHCGCGRMEMDPIFMAKLGLLRTILRFPLVVSSGFRCPAHNDAVSTTGTTGPHTTGKAVDILINRRLATVLLQFALNSGFTGIGIRQHGPDSNRIIHLDMCDRHDQIIWTY